MATQTRTVLKTYFETGDFPTQAQFENFIDSCPNIVDNNILLDGDNAITAHAGGGQANAYLLTKLMNTVSVCASAHDSIKVPVIGAGGWCAVVNGTANIVDIYPPTGGQIMGAGVNVPYQLASAKCVILGTTNGSTWAALLGA